MTDHTPTPEPATHAPMDPVHILGVGAEPAPRQVRRDTVRHILDRLDCGLTLTENERLALRNRINAEQADADQAREQLAAARAGDAPWIKAYREDLNAADKRVKRAEAGRIAADNVIRAVCDALGVGPDTDPVIRARETLARAERAEIEATRAEAAADLRRQRAEQLKRSRDYWKRTAEQADADLTAVRKRLNAEVTELRTRAEQAEATLARVRAIAGWAINGWSDLSPEKVLAALGDPQPATETERCGQYGGHGEYCDYPREPGSEQCAFHAAEARTHDAEPDAEPEAGHHAPMCPGCKECTVPPEPLLRGPAPQVHIHLDNQGALYHPWPQEWRTQPTEGGKSEYRRTLEREAEQHVTVYGISVNEWDRLWLTVQRIADAAGVEAELPAEDADALPLPGDRVTNAHMAAAAGLTPDPTITTAALDAEQPDTKPEAEPLRIPEQAARYLHTALGLLLGEQP